ncbi:RNA polymerase sigma factor [Cellulomonas hominis]
MGAPAPEAGGAGAPRRTGVVVADWEEVLDDLVHERGPALVRYAALLTGSTRDAEDLVQAALATLRPRLRACVVLRYYDDLTVPEIARQLGLSDGTVKRYLSDAINALEAVLGPVPAPTELHTVTLLPTGSRS